MISHNTSISSFGKRKSLPKEKDYELLHYFDDQSDDDSSLEKSKSKNKNKKNNEESSSFMNSSSDSKEENFFECDKDSQFDMNEKIIEKSPDNNYGKVYKNNIILIYYLHVCIV